MEVLCASDSLVATSCILIVALLFARQVVLSLTWLRAAIRPKHVVGPSKYQPTGDGPHAAFFVSKATGLWIHTHSWEGAPALRGGDGMHRRDDGYERMSPPPVVFIVHGLGEHLGRYDHVARALTQSGMSVFAHDHCGHGRSEGDRVYVESFADYMSDLVQFVREVRPHRSGEVVRRRVYLLGHSMGALVVALSAKELQNEIHGAILSAPALAFATINCLRAVASSVGSWLPHAIVSVEPSAGVCSDASVYSAYQRDPLVVWGQLPMRTARELFNASKLAMQSSASFPSSLPILIVHGADDGLCPASGATEFFGRLPPTMRSKTFKIYMACAHEVFHEPGRLLYLSDVIAWLQCTEEAYSKGSPIAAVLGPPPPPPSRTS